MHPGKFQNKRLFGSSIEVEVAQMLRKRGLLLLHRNYNCRAGEIDLIMVDAPQQLVFVEVRFRNNCDFGSALESVDRRKQRKLKLAAANFLSKYPRYNRYRCRFDVVALGPNEDGDFQGIDWIKNAFA